MHSASQLAGASTPRIEIFYSELCSSCHEAMDYFRARQLPYEAFEIRWSAQGMVDSEAARDLRQRCGEVDFVPQIFINNRHIGGWTALTALIESGELESLLQVPPNTAPSPPHA